MKALAAILFVCVSGVAAQGPPPPPPPPLPPSPTGGAAPARDIPFLPPSGGAAIAGTVVTADERHAPVRAAIVTLRGDGFRTGWTYVTDTDGRFSFNALPAGRFLLTAARAGSPSMNYGASRAGRPGTSIVLKENATAADLKIALPRGAVVSGRLLDETGTPVAGARVVVGSLTTRNGERTIGFGGSAFSDDRGEYRVFGLAAGDYAVSVDARGFGPTIGATRYGGQDIDAFLTRAGAASQPGQSTPPPPKGQAMAITTTYYPDAASIADAGAVHLDAGEERLDVDVHLQYVPSTTLSGVILDPEGKPPSNVILNLVQAGVRGGPPKFGRPSPTDGTFSFSGLTPGHYIVTGRATTAQQGGAGSMPPLWARADVDISGTPIDGLRMTLQPGASVSGAVVFDSPTGMPALSASRISLVPVLTAGDVALGVSAATMEKDRTFSFVGVPPGRYRVDAQSNTIASNTRWMLKTATLNGQDALDEPIEVGGGDLSGLTVTYTDVISELGGSLEDASGRPAPDYYVIVFPVDQKYWFQNSRRIKAARPGLDGKYLIRGLPPGTYRIGAVIDVEPGEWFEASFLQQLAPAAAEVTLGDGEKKSFPLKIGG